MIDLHSHILPAIDDGAATLATSLEMARTAVADGITTVAATPHSPDSLAGKRYSVELLDERLATLREALAQEQIPLTIVRGTEITIASDLVPRLRKGELLTYEGCKALLLECPGSHMPDELPDVIFQLQAAGYRVLLAHPERLREVQREPGVLAPLVERGALVQITAEALLGQRGETWEQTSHALVQRGLAHVLASDAHGIPPRRPLQLAAARDRAAQLVGQPLAHALVHDIPDALLHDRAIQLPPPQSTPHSKKWRLW